MPIVKEREYRQMIQPLMIPTGTAEKRFDTEYYVEGFATTFNKPYVMYEYNGIKYYEVIDRKRPCRRGYVRRNNAVRPFRNGIRPKQDGEK